MKRLAIFLMTIIIFLITFLMTGCNDSKDEPKNIGFIILGDVNKSGWNAEQYNGIKAACEKYNLKLLVRDKVVPNSGQCQTAIRELASENAGMIFLASYSYSKEVKNLLGKYPEISFATNSAEVHAKNMTAYFVKMYQARYLAGALAGLMTKSNKIGYVAAIKNSEVNRGINAFALGVQRVNPNAKVFVTWTNSWQDESKEIENTNKLIQKIGVDVITYHQDESTTADTAESLGVNYIAYNQILKSESPHYLASIICHWDLYYTDIIKHYLGGDLNAVKNRWIGIKENVVELANISSSIDPAIINQIESLKEELKNDKMIFSDEIFDNEDCVRCIKGKVIGDDFLIERMIWLVKGIEVVN